MYSESPSSGHTHTRGKRRPGSRQRSDALGRVSDVPDFDVGGGDGEDQAGAVADGHHVVGVTGKGHDLLARHQVPYFAGAVCRWRAGLVWGPSQIYVTDKQNISSSLFYIAAAGDQSPTRCSPCELPCVQLHMSTTGVAKPNS